MPAAPAEIIVRQALATQQSAVPTDVTNYRVAVFDVNGDAVYGPTTMQKAAEVSFEVPISGVFLRLEYLSDGQVVALYEQGVRLQSGQTLIIENPSFIPATGGLASLAFSPETMSLSIGESADFSLFATFTDGTVTDVTQYATFGVENPDTAVLNGAAQVVGVSSGSTLLLGQLFETSAVAVVGVGNDPFNTYRLIPTVDPLNVEVGQEREGSFTLIDTEGQATDVSDRIALTSQDSSVADIVDEGTVLGAALGSTQLLATDPDSGAQVVMDVSVVDPNTLPIFRLDDGKKHLFHTSDGTLDGVVHPGWNGSQLVLSSFEILNASQLVVLGPSGFEVEVFGDAFISGSIHARGGEFDILPSIYHALMNVPSFGEEDFADGYLAFLFSIFGTRGVTDAGPGGGAGGSYQSSLSGLAGSVATTAASAAQLSAAGRGGSNGAGGGGGHRYDGFDGEGAVPGVGGSGYGSDIGFFGGAGGGGGHIVPPEPVDDDFPQLTFNNLINLLLPDFGKGGGGGGAVRINATGTVEFEFPSNLQEMLEEIGEDSDEELLQALVDEYTFIDASGGDSLPFRLLLYMENGLLENTGLFDSEMLLTLSGALGGGGAGGSIIIDASEIVIEESALPFGLRVFGGDSLSFGGFRPFGDDLFEDFPELDIQAGGLGSPGVILLNEILQPEVDPNDAQFTLFGFIFIF